MLRLKKDLTKEAAAKLSLRQVPKSKESMRQHTISVEGRVADPKGVLLCAFLKWSDLLRVPGAFLIRQDDR
jgi:hypothetical protein